MDRRAMTKVLFILKKRDNPIGDKPISTGLYNSANFVHEMLVKNGVNSKLAVVVDNNCIDREVTLFGPDIVIVEAVWVVPEKFAILHQLHPKVKWIIRVHSDLPFMACEGMAMDWILDYVNCPNVRVSPNSQKMLYDIQTICVGKHAALDKDIVYLPNYYPTIMSKPKAIDYDKPWVDISCFGAIRPLKNQLIQLVAAVDFVQKVGCKRLKFHVNTGRIESNGMPVDHNLRGLAQQLDPSRYELIFHHWANHEDFLSLSSEMDIAMQVSFSETFNIVGADQVVQGVPFLGCDEIPWYTQGPVLTNNAQDIRDHLLNIYEQPIRNVKINQYDLTKYVEDSEKTWLGFLESETR
jgi:hypothetical protein